MRIIDKSILSLQQFKTAIDEKKSVVCRKGKWEVQGAFLRFVYWLFRLNDKRIANIGFVFARCIRELENSKVFFHTNRNGSFGHLVREQNDKFTAFLETADSIGQMLSKKNKRIQEANLELLKERTSFEYRIGSVNGGKDRLTELNKVDYGILKSFAFEWKEKNKNIPLEEKELNVEDLNHLAFLSRYPKFAQIVMSDKNVRQNFFNWTLRDNLSTQVFVEYPLNSQILKKSCLAMRLGRFAGKALIVSNFNSKKKPELLKKDLRLKFVGKADPISLTKKNKAVILPYGWKLTIAEVLKIFSEKKIKIGNLEVFEDGIANWNGYELGTWNPYKQNPDPKKKGDFERLDVNSPDFFKQLPIFERLTAEQIAKKYHIDLPYEDESFAVVKASRRYVQLDVLQSHSWISAIVPDGEGKFIEIPYGIYPEKNPTNCLTKALFVAQTNLAKTSFPDENEFFSHRQHAYVVYSLEEMEKDRLLISMQSIFQKAKEGNLILQFSAKTNCAGNTQETLENVLGKASERGKVPNLFKMNVMDTRPTGIFGKIFGLFRKFPKSAHPTLMKGLTYVLGGNKKVYIIENGKKVSRSLTGTDFLTTMEIHTPAQLHDSIGKGTFTKGAHISAFLTFGHKGIGL